MPLILKSKLVINFLRQNWLKVRYLYPDYVKILFLIFQYKKYKSSFEVRKDESIVIVGIGISGITFANELVKRGYTNISIIANNLLYGGKCVNYGCMPTEFSLWQAKIGQINTIDNVQEFVKKLRGNVELQVKGLNLNLISESVEYIERNKIYLESGESIDFSRLAICMGSDYETPKKIKINSNKVIKIDNLWSIPADKKLLIIHAHNNISALSVASTANSLGMKVIILLEGSNPLKNQPSYKYYEMSLKKDGIHIHNNIRLIRIDDAISFEKGAEIETLPYDYLLFISKPVPRIPKIDNKEININDIDFKHNKLSFRADISLIGDSSFMFTAAEAEYHAKMTVDNWINNKEINLKELSSIPFCLHGSISLGTASNEYYVQHNLNRWIEIDFKEIGWSSIGNYPGKLWYVKCEKSNMILSLHICHSHANELISIGKILMNYPLDHDVWLSSFIHPSASEIFKKIAEKERLN